MQKKNAGDIYPRLTERNEMMEDPIKNLQGFRKEHDFLVGIDSDGCAFDSMEIKHKECFIPNTINEWGLQAISKYAREAAEFVNLYSRWRGINRFPALINVFELLEDREEVKKREFKLPEYEAIKTWMNSESKLGNPTLEKEVARTGDPVLSRALKWSVAVNKTIEEMVHDVPPFPFVRKSLDKMFYTADILVVSATPFEALEREWKEHGIAEHVKVIAGQEMGSKAEILKIAKKGRYDQEHVLMIGDAIGDMNAAKSNGVLFYPINPGNEDESWERFHSEAFERFTSGNYKGAYEEKVIAEFEKYLPSTPPWKIKKEK